MLMITQDIITKLWNEAGNGNVAIWADGTMTVVTPGSTGETAGRTPLVVLKPIALINKYELLFYALRDEELLAKIEEMIRSAGGEITRGPQA
jgi:hypothetical protein